MFLIKSKHSVTLYLFLYVTLILRHILSNLRRILVGKLRYIKIRYFLGNYHVQHISQIHILNFNHEYLITAAVATAAVLPPPPPCCHAAAATLLPLLCCCCRCAVASTAVLPPTCRHRHCHHAATTATAVAKLPLLPLSCHHCRYLH